VSDRTFEVVRVLGDNPAGDDSSWWTAFARGLSPWARLPRPTVPGSPWRPRSSAASPWRRRWGCPASALAAWRPPSRRCSWRARASGRGRRCPSTGRWPRMPFRGASGCSRSGEGPPGRRCTRSGSRSGPAPPARPRPRCARRRGWPARWPPPSPHWWPDRSRAPGLQPGPAASSLSRRSTRSRAATPAPRPSSSFCFSPPWPSPCAWNRRAIVAPPLSSARAAVAAARSLGESPAWLAAAVARRDDAVAWTQRTFALLW